MRDWEIRQALRDNSMRRALLKFLQEATKEERLGHPTWPEPMLEDEQITEELHRILRVRKGWFR